MKKFFAKFYLQLILRNLTRISSIVEKGTNTASAAIYNANDKGEGKLTQITSEEEWTMLEEMLDDYYNNRENGCGGSCRILQRL